MSGQSSRIWLIDRFGFVFRNPTKRLPRSTSRIFRFLPPPIVKAARTAGCDNGVQSFLSENPTDCPAKSTKLNVRSPRKDAAAPTYQQDPSVFQLIAKKSHRSTT